MNTGPFVEVNGSLLAFCRYLGGVWPLGMDATSDFT